MIAALNNLFGISRSNAEVADLESMHEIDCESEVQDTVEDTGPTDEEETYLLELSPRPKVPPVTLIIGGTSFNVPRDVLLREKNSLFCAMTEHQEYHISRDPFHFPSILNHMKGGLDIITSFLRLAEEQKFGLLEDAKFYGLNSLVALLECLLAQQREWVFDATAKHDDVILSEDGVTARGSYTVSGYPVLGTHSFVGGVHSWRFRVDELGSLMIAVCVKQSMSLDDEDFDNVWGVCYNPSSSNVDIFNRGVCTPVAGDSKLKVGKPVEVLLDCEKGYLKVNGVVVDNLPQLEFHPVFLMGRDTQISLM
jgi:hypothetical protein